MKHETVSSDDDGKDMQMGYATLLFFGILLAAMLMALIALASMGGLEDALPF